MSSAARADPRYPQACPRAFDPPAQIAFLQFLANAEVWLRLCRTFAAPNKPLLRKRALATAGHSDCRILAQSKTKTALVPARPLHIFFEKGITRPSPQLGHEY